MTPAPQHAPTAPLSEVTFRNPPPARRYDWPAIAIKVRSRPMEWALVFEQGRTSTVNAIRAGKIKAIHPDLGFETLTSNNTRESPRTCDLYLRFNPDEVRTETPR